MCRAACLLLSLILALGTFAALLPRPGAQNDGLRSAAVIVARLDTVRQVHGPDLHRPDPLPVTRHLLSPGRSDDADDADDADDVTATATAAHAHEVAHADDLSAYLPAPQLTERPRLLHDAASSWTLLPVPLETDCLLLINEYGDVDRVLFDRTALTPAQQQALHERLMPLHFMPGSLFGRKVKTALRISVRVD